MLTDDHILEEVFELLVGNNPFTFENYRTGEHIKVDAITDTLIDSKRKNITLSFFVSDNKGGSMLDYLLNLGDVKYVYFNNKDRRFDLNDIGQVSNYYYHSGHKEDISEIYISQGLIDESFVKITMQYSI